MWLHGFIAHLLDKIALHLVVKPFVLGDPADV